MARDYFPARRLVRQYGGLERQAFGTRKDGRVYSKRQLRGIGSAEARRVDTSLPRTKRILAEVEEYNRKYGPASPEDINLELNSRGKDLEFQGKLTIYSYRNRLKTRHDIAALVRAGALRRVKVMGSQPGYVVA